MECFHASNRTKGRADAWRRFFHCHLVCAHVNAHIRLRALSKHLFVQLLERSAQIELLTPILTCNIQKAFSELVSDRRVADGIAATISHYFRAVIR